MTGSCAFFCQITRTRTSVVAKCGKKLVQYSTKLSTTQLFQPSTLWFYPQYIIYRRKFEKHRFKFGTKLERLSLGKQEVTRKKYHYILWRYLRIRKANNPHTTSGVKIPTRITSLQCLIWLFSHSFYFNTMEMLFLFYPTRSTFRVYFARFIYFDIY